MCTARFSLLSAARRKEYVGELRFEQARLAEDNSVGELRASAELDAACVKLANVQAQTAPPLTIDACKLSDDEVKDLEQFVSSFPGAAARCARAVIAEAPPMRSAPYFQSLNATPVLRVKDTISADGMQGWTKQVILHREEFTSCVFRVSNALCGPHFYGFAFALQQPYVLCLSVLTELAVYPSLDIASMEELDAAVSMTSHKFTTDLQTFVLTETVLHGVPDDNICILEDVRFTGGFNLECAGGQWIPLRDKLSTLPDLPARQATVRQPANPDWTQNQHHWTPYMRNLSQSTDPNPPYKNPEPDVVDVLDDDDINHLLDGIYKAHGELPAEQDEKDFRVACHGSLYTIVHRGVGHDAYVGKPTNVDAEDWANLYQLGRSASFSTAPYGAEGSRIMANTWVAKAEHFYNIFKAAGDANCFGFAHPAEANQSSETRAQIP